MENIIELYAGRFKESQEIARVSLKFKIISLTIEFHVYQWKTCCEVFEKRKKKNMIKHRSEQWEEKKRGEKQRE